MKSNYVIYICLFAVLYTHANAETLNLNSITNNINSVNGSPGSILQVNPIILTTPPPVIILTSSITNNYVHPYTVAAISPTDDASLKSKFFDGDLFIKDNAIVRNTVNYFIEPINIKDKKNQMNVIFNGDGTYTLRLTHE